MAHQQLEAGLTVAEVLDRWPQTIPVFIRHRMACVGCTIASFETLSEVADIYQLEPDEFLQELQHLLCVDRARLADGGESTGADGCLLVGVAKLFELAV